MIETFHIKQSIVFRKATEVIKDFDYIVEVTHGFHELIFCICISLQTLFD